MNTQSHILFLAASSDDSGSDSKCLKCDQETTHRSGLCASCRKQPCAKCSKPFIFNGERYCSQCKYKIRRREQHLGVI